LDGVETLVRGIQDDLLVGIVGAIDDLGWIPLPRPAQREARDRGQRNERVARSLKRQNGVVIVGEGSLFST